MKRNIIAAATVIALCLLCACGTVTYNPDTNSESKTEADTQPDVFASIADYYIFQSGAGAWRTVLKVNDDGSIEGRYLCGSAGGPEICDFTGRFTDLQKLDDYSYSVKLENVEYTEPGTVFKTFEDGTEMLTTNPHGLYSSDTGTVSEKFVIYLPGTQENAFDEDFKDWANINGISCSPALESFVIYNQEGKYPFFESDEETYNAIVLA